MYRNYPESYNNQKRLSTRLLISFLKGADLSVVLCISFYDVRKQIPFILSHKLCASAFWCQKKIQALIYNLVTFRFS